jgi:hypothetical protein
MRRGWDYSLWEHDIERVHKEYMREMRGVTRRENQERLESP